ncbi:MAG: class II aldolase/adducin family protein [Salinivirgaceae bacterium]
MLDEGYIKYTFDWNKREITIPAEVLSELNFYRNKLRALKMIGKIPDGPGFGNISVRANGDAFFISGSDTGSKELLGAEQVALVTQCNYLQNHIVFEGQIAASSESMSHAAIYKQHMGVGAVIHVHQSKLWNHYLNDLPTTEVKAAYGTPALAEAIAQKVCETPGIRLLVLGGHEDGIISYGSNLQEAYNVLMQWYRALL